MEALWPILSVICLLLILGGLAFVARWRSLTRRVGSFASAVRKPGKTGTSSFAWRRGVAHYCVDRIDWYRLTALSFRPLYSWPRSQLDLVEREPVTEDDGLKIREFSQRVECSSEGKSFEIALSAEAYSGLRSWVESAPPGDMGKVV